MNKFKSLYYQLLLEKGWKKLPKGWTRKSLEKYCKSFLGGEEHPFTKCYEKMKDKLGEERAKRFCASLKDQCYGTTKWRGNPEVEKRSQKKLKK